MLYCGLSTAGKNPDVGTPVLAAWVVSPMAADALHASGHTDFYRVDSLVSYGSAHPEMTAMHSVEQTGSLTTLPRDRIHTYGAGHLAG